MPPNDSLSILGAAAMVANCAIGAGVLSFPFAVRCCGVAIGAVVIVGGAALLAGSLHILASGAALSGGLTYQGVIRRVLPPRPAAFCGELLEVTMYIYLLGVGAAFFNVIADQLLPLLTPAGSFLTHGCEGSQDFALPGCRVTIVALYAAVLELPLCVVRDLSLFRYTSGFSVCAIAYLVAIVVKYAVAAPPSDWVWVNTEQPLLIFKALPLVLFAFNCHLAYIPIFNRLKAPIRNVRSMDKVALCAYAVCLGAYLSCGIFGYVAFGRDTPGDVLQRMPTTAFNATLPSGVRCDADAASTEAECCVERAWGCPWDVAVARVAIALTVSTSFPILQFVARECLDDLLVNHGLVARARTRTRWVLEALFFVVVTAGVSIVQPHLTDILDIIATLFATLQVAVLPALLVYHIYVPVRAPAAAAAEPAQAFDSAPSELPRPSLPPVAAANGGPAFSSAPLNSRLLEDGAEQSHDSAKPATYFVRQAAALTPQRRRGLPHLSRACAGAVVGLYGGLAFFAAALYYATINVRPK